MLKGNSNPRYNEVHIGTNCIRTCLLFKLLLPILTKSALSSLTGSVRVLWAGSVAIHTKAPQPDGMLADDAGRPTDTDVLPSYGQSKADNVFLIREYAKTTPQKKEWCMFASIWGTLGLTCNVIGVVSLLCLW